MIATKVTVVRGGHEPSGRSRWRGGPVRWVLAIGLLAAGLLWSYWPTLTTLAGEWAGDPDYSVGQLVPLVAAYLVWRGRARLWACQAVPCWWGLGVIGLGQGLRLFGLMFLYESAERYSLVLTIAGLVLLLGGWQVFRSTAWILLFLCLMVPLPGRIHSLISGPMQSQATTGAVLLLELAGVTVARDGNVIVLNSSVPLAVAEACSGLRMLTAFIVVAATLAFLVRRPRWQKAVLLASSILVAILCNLIRLFATAELFLATSSQTAERFFHDFAGLVMMPLAVLMLAGELWLMNRLVVPDKRPAAQEDGPGSGLKCPVRPVSAIPAAHPENASGCPVERNIDPPGDLAGPP